MLEQAEDEGAATGDFVEFGVAGGPASGVYHCADCGYGITVQATLPRCPMCGGSSWERPARPPLMRPLWMQ